MKDRRRLIENLKREGYIKSEEIENAMLKVPREIFVPEHLKRYAYVDTPLDIGFGQTISAPHMVAIMCEELALKKGMKVLEIGTGSGYHAAVISEIIGSEGKIYTVERIPELAKFAEKNLKNVGIKNVKVVLGDGSLGLQDFAPYDRILVTCAAPDIPEPLSDQLKEDGIIVIPVGRSYSMLVKGIKRGGSIQKMNITGCSFVPLIGTYGFQSR